MKKYLLPLIAGPMMAIACGSASVAISFSNTTVPKLSASSPASFDVVEIDQAAHRLYTTDRTDPGVDVFDTTLAPAKYVATVPLKATPNGLALAPDLNRVFVGTTDGSVAVIDVNPTSPSVDKVVKQVPTGGKTVDLIDYAPSLHEVFASNGIEGTIAVIDATTASIKTSFKVGYALEQPRFNAGDGMLYVSSPDADAVFRLDSVTGAIKQKIKLGACLPRGMAIDPRSNQAVIACTSDVRRWNLRNITDATVFGGASGGDIVNFDAATGQFFVGGAKTLASSGVAVFGGSPIAYVTTVHTGSGGSSAAFDNANHLVYTTDSRPGKAGVESFAVPSTGLDFALSLQSLSLVGVLLVVVVLVMYFVGKGGDPVNRPEPLTRRRRAS